MDIINCSQRKDRQDDSDYELREIYLWQKVVETQSLERFKCSCHYCLYIEILLTIAHGE